LITAEQEDKEEAGGKAKKYPSNKPISAINRSQGVLDYRDINSRGYAALRARGIVAN